MHKFMKPKFEQKSLKPIYFKVDGDPIPFFKSRHTTRKTYDYIQTAISNFKINLASTLEDRFAPLAGPLFMHIDFYLPYHYKNESYLINRAHYDYPKLTRLVEFVEECAQEVDLLSEAHQLASINAQKQYSDQPRTEFMIYEVIA